MLDEVRIENKKRSQLKISLLLVMTKPITNLAIINSELNKESDLIKSFEKYFVVES